MFIQPALEIGRVDDPQEKEANAVADKVMRMTDGTEGQQRLMKDGTEKLQMKCTGSEGNEQEKIQRVVEEKGTESISGAEKNKFGSVNDPMGVSAKIKSDMEKRIINQIESDFSDQHPTKKNTQLMANIIMQNSEEPFIAIIENKARCFVITRFSVDLVDEKRRSLFEYENESSGGETRYSGFSYPRYSAQLYSFIYDPEPLIPARVRGNGYFMISIRLDERPIEECGGHKGKT